MMRFFSKHPHFWGNLLIAAAVIGSNAGSAWAGAVYQSFISAPPGENSAPANVGFQALAWTVYPLAFALLALGVYLRNRHKRSWAAGAGSPHSSNAKAIYSGGWTRGGRCVII